MKTLHLPKHQELSVRDIIFLESDSNYTIIHKSVYPNKVLVALTLRRIQEFLENEHFIRINRAHLINPFYLKSFKHMSPYVMLKLKDGRELISSRRRTEDILDRLTKKTKKFDL